MENVVMKQCLTDILGECQYIYQQFLTFCTQASDHPRKLTLTYLYNILFFMSALNQVLVDFLKTNGYRYNE